MNKLNILVLLIGFMYSCTSVVEDTTSSIDEIIKVDNYMLEGKFIKKINDSLNVYDCKVYDTLNNRLVISGEYIVYSDEFSQPIGWLKYWDETGKLIEEVDYGEYNDSREIRTNQVIKFGAGSFDTIFQESHYLKHNICYLNEDTVEIKLIYRGWRENKSNYAFLPLTEIDDEFIFRTKKPTIKFKLPIRKFIEDSIIRIYMIKTNDVDSAPDMINMQFIHYNIKLKDANNYFQ